MTNITSKKARFIKPPNKLKAKVGHGGLDPKVLEKAQEFITNNNVDFIPIANDFLQRMEESEKKLQESNDNKSRNVLIESIMQLKASGGMFKYQLVSEIADSCLHFIENIEDYNNDAHTVVKAHENTIKIILRNKLMGDGGKEGYALVKELNKASTRYFSKHQNDAKA